MGALVEIDPVQIEWRLYPSRLAMQACDKITAFMRIEIQRIEVAAATVNLVLAVLTHGVEC